MAVETSESALPSLVSRTFGSCRTFRLTFARAAKESGRGGFSDEPSAADTATQWRRAGPLPSRAEPERRNTGNRFDSGFGASGSGMDAADVDWSAARGSKFVAREAPPAGGFNRGPPRETREGGFNSLADVPNDWRSSRPARAPPAMESRESFRGQGRGFAEREVGLTGEAAAEESWSRGSKFKASEPRSAMESRRTSAAEEKGDWRSGKKSLDPTRELGVASFFFSTRADALSSLRIGRTVPADGTKTIVPLAAHEPDVAHD